MSLYIRKDYVFNETYPEDLDYIWEYLNKYGFPLFHRNKLEKMWRHFSDEKYSAGFMTPNDDIIQEFIDWLEDQDE